MPQETANLGLPFVLAAQAQKHVTVNESLRIIDAVAQISVISRTTTTPPGSPAEGDRYIVGSGATGAWDGWDLNVAVWMDGDWFRLVARDGWIAWVEDETSLYIRDGANWVGFGVAAGFVTLTQLEDGSVELLGVNSTADTTNRLSVASPGSLFTHGATPGGHLMTINKSAAGQNAGITLQQGFSTRALLGLQGNDDFTIKVSPDGSNFVDIVFDKDTGLLTLPNFVQAAGGSASSPAYSFESDTDSGFYRNNANEVGIATDGAQRLLVANSQVNVSTGDLLVNNAGGNATTTVNKNTAGDDATLSFQTGFSSKAILGLLGNDDFTLKTGDTFEEALVVKEKSGRAIFKKIQEGPTPWNVVYRNYVTNASWLSSTSAANYSWRGVCWSPELGLFCAVASSGSGDRVMTSPDGITWTTRTSAADNNWYSVCWSPELGLFCAVADSGTGNRVMTSPDGITWTTRTSAADNSWRGVCWSPELGLFCAVAFTGSGNRVMTSPDGITWTTRTSAADNNWLSVCWSPELGLFCAAAASGTGNRVMTSPDGITWTTRTSAADNDWRGVCWSPELGLFCAVASSGSGDRVMTSPDGITWTTRTSAADNNWYSVCWSPELGLFCAVAFTGTGNRVMSSPDGITWTTRTSAADNNWNAVCWSPELGLSCAVSSSGSGDRVMTSVSAYSFNYRS